MKQLLSMSKQRKENKIDLIKKQLILQNPTNQQQNFIYCQTQDNQPTNQQIFAYATILGIKLPEEEDLLYLAKECLLQETPAEWRCQENDKGEIIYINKKTGVTSLQHPCDEIYRERVIRERKMKLLANKKSLTKINIPKSKTTFHENIFNKNEIEDINPIDNLYIKKRNKKGQQYYDNNQFEKGSCNQFNQFDSKNDNFIKKVEKQSSQHPTNIRENRIQKQAKHPKNIPNKIDIYVNSKSNQKLFQKNKQQIQQKIIKKYFKINDDLQIKYKQITAQLEDQQLQYQSFKNQLIQKQIQTIVDRKKKQIQIKYMLQHTSQLDKLKIQYQKQYRNSILFIGQKYQIDHLFTEIGQCRKFVNRENKDQQNYKYIQQIQENVKVINKMQIEKLIAEVERECRTLMHQILNQIIQNKQLDNISNSEILKEMTEKFNEAIERITNQHKLNNNLQDIVGSKLYMKRGENVQEDQGEGEKLLNQLESLRARLTELKQINSSHRSNLSDRQTKLFDLLQKGVSHRSD